MAKYTLGLCAFDAHEISAWAASALESAVQQSAPQSSQGELPAQVALLYLLDAAVGGKSSTASPILQFPSNFREVGLHRFEEAMRQRQAWIESQSESPTGVTVCPAAVLACARVAAGSVPCCFANPALHFLARTVCD